MSSEQQESAIKAGVDYSQKKLKGYDFFKAMGSPRYVVAPMVDQSELPFRMLCREYGSELAYTPMFHSKIWCNDHNYRKVQFSTCAGDGPLFVQFCSNNPEIAVRAGKLLLSEDFRTDKSEIGPALPDSAFSSEEEKMLYYAKRNNVSSFDLNLGCPQNIAKRGHYGSFLMEEPSLICEILSELDRQLPIPITCKIRVFPDVKQTLQYAEQLITKGKIAMLAVHGRTREQKGHNMGLADWQQIKMIKELVCDKYKIPLIANGNILTMEHVNKCLEETGAVAVMSAETLLAYPALFSSIPNEDCIVMARKYLNLVRKYAVPMYMPRSHLFKILYPILDHHNQLKAKLGGVGEFEQFEQVVNMCEQVRNEMLKKHQVADSDTVAATVADSDTVSASASVSVSASASASASASLVLKNTYFDKRHYNVMNTSGNNNQAPVLPTPTILATSILPASTVLPDPNQSEQLLKQQQRLAHQAQVQEDKKKLEEFGHLFNA